jgi:hypothetical protein
MAKAKEAKTVKVTNAEGKELVVTERAFEVVYKGHGYTAADAQQQEENDYFQYSADELKKVTNDKLKAFLDQEEIEYPSNATKDDLIVLITGE